MKDFRDLRVWEKAHQLTLDVYKATIQFPREEAYGLVSQMQRCSASIGANITEGCGKLGNNEFHHCLQIASGSASELDYHFLLARDLHFLPDSDYRRLAGDLSQKNAHIAASKDRNRTPGGLNANCQLLSAAFRTSSLP